MPVIITRDARHYAGRDAAGAVDAMRDAGLFVRGLSREKYMRGVAFRIGHLDGWNVRHDTPEHFLADLAAYGIIELKELN